MAAMTSGEKPPILDVTATMLEPLNKEMVAMLVSHTNPQGIELNSFAVSLLFKLKNMAADHVSENRKYTEFINDRQSIVLLFWR